MLSESIKVKMIALLQDWLVCYQIYFPEYVTTEQAARRINSGECGNTAQAIFLVLQQNFPDQKEVKLYANLNHAFLLHENLGYDVQVQEGEPVSFFNEKYMDLDAKECSLKEVFDAYTYCDPLGCMLIRDFLQRHATPVPEYFLKVIEEEIGPGDAEWIAKYIQPGKDVAAGLGLK